MFPTSDSSQTIIDTLLEAAEKAGVELYRQKRCLVFLEETMASLR